MCNCVSSVLMSRPFLSGTHPSLSYLATINPRKGGFQLLVMRNKNNNSNPKSFSKPENCQIYGQEDPDKGFDFLEFDKKEIHTFEDQDDLVQLETCTNPSLEEKGKQQLRKGRQIIRRNSILAKQVISVHSALALGFVSQLWVDTCLWVVHVVEVRSSMLSGEMERFLLEDVCKVGDVVLVEDESVMEEDIKMLGLDTLVGYNVVTPSRRSIGKVRGFTFNINSGAVELLELDSFGISVIPSSLVSTYGLFVEDVIDVESDNVVVHEAAASRVQRLTKGLLDTSMEEHLVVERERGPTQSTSRRKTSTMEESEDDLQLPMDYL